MANRYATEAVDGSVGRVSGEIVERKVAVVNVNIPELFDNDYSSVELVINGRRYGQMSTGKARQLGILSR